jgi:hypothetical protein
LAFYDFLFLLKKEKNRTFKQGFKGEGAGFRMKKERSIKMTNQKICSQFVFSSS